MKAQYLITATDVYVVSTVKEVEELHEELKNDKTFELRSFSYRTKPIKEKGEVIGEYQVVTAKKKFNEEKEPETKYEIDYRVG